MGDVEMMQVMQMRQLFGGGNTLVEGVCLVGLFALVLFRRESVVSWRLFRFAYLFLALAIVLPSLIMAFFQIEPGTLSQMGVNRGYAGRLVFGLALTAIGPLCLAASIVCAFGSILPHNTFTSPAPSEPKKHPLD